VAGGVQPAEQRVPRPVDRGTARQQRCDGQPGAVERRQRDDADRAHPLAAGAGHPAAGAEIGVGAIRGVPEHAERGGQRVAGGVHDRQAWRQAERLRRARPQLAGDGRGRHHPGQQVRGQLRGDQHGRPPAAGVDVQQSRCGGGRGVDDELAGEAADQLTGRPEQHRLGPVGAGRFVGEQPRPLRGQVGRVGTAPTACAHAGPSSAVSAACSAVARWSE
jgi:hypothetical protein